MRSKPRTDANQAAIVNALRRAGATVQILAGVGQGCPDLLVGVHGDNRLLEVKDGAKSPSRRRLTPDEARWQAEWRGEVVTVASVDEALTVVGVRR